MDTTTTMDKKFALLQVNDALFPIGAYAHSYGVETYVQKGKIHCAQTALTYMENYLRGSFLYNDLLAVVLAYQNAVCNMEKVLELEELFYASKCCTEAKEAMCKLGMRFLKNTVPHCGCATFQRYANTTKHHIHSVAYGVWCQSLGLDKESVLEHYIYGQTSNLVVACVKLVPLSQTEGQDILFKLQSTMREILCQVLALDEGSLGRSYFGFDVAAMEHEVLYSRLYMS